MAVGVPWGVRTAACISQKYFTPLDLHVWIFLPASWSRSSLPLTIFTPTAFTEREPDKTSLRKRGYHVKRIRRV